MSEPFEFFGVNLTNAECEKIALLRIPPVLREREADLFKTKWFDYRALHPIKATYLFAHQYELAAKRMFAKTRDIDEAENVRPLGHQDLFQGGDTVALWRARQAFDAIGVRYEFGIDFALNRANDRGWSYFPRPNQLYGPELLLDMKEAWNKHCREVYQRTKHPRFTSGEYTGHPDQEAFRRWLLDQVKMRQQPASLLSTLLRDGLLDEQTVLRELGEEQLAKAKRF